MISAEQDSTAVMEFRSCDQLTKEVNLRGFNIRYKDVAIATTPAIHRGFFFPEKFPSTI
jgi:hypothetical protein